jgi:hypothetical protein
MAKYRALTGLSLRKSPDPTSPLYEQWFEWAAGEEFDAPQHLDTKRGVARGIMEQVK